jgi:hypothetical protein
VKAPLRAYCTGSRPTCSKAQQRRAHSAEQAQAGVTQDSMANPRFLRGALAKGADRALKPVAPF